MEHFSTYNNISVIITAHFNRKALKYDNSDNKDREVQTHSQTPPQNGNSVFRDLCTKHYRKEVGEELRKGHEVRRGGGGHYMKTERRPASIK